MSNEHNGNGRPSIYSPELARQICDRVADGETLLRICADEGMPSRRTVQLWCDNQPDFLRSYARARLHGATALVEDVDDRITRMMQDGEIDREKVKSISMLIRELATHRRWLAERFDRETYGASVNIDHRVTQDLSPELQRMQIVNAAAKLCSVDRELAIEVVRAIVESAPTPQGALPLLEAVAVDPTG